MRDPDTAPPSDLHPFWKSIGEADMPKPNMRLEMRRAVRNRGRKLATQHEADNAGHRVARIEPDLIYKCRDCEWQATLSVKI